MLLQGASAQETARRFRVNTGAVVQWARLAGMVIRMGARGGVVPACCSDPAPDPQRAYRRLTHGDRVFIEMAINSTPAWSIRAMFPDRPELWVSHETIYQALYVQGRGILASRTDRDQGAAFETFS